MLGLVMARDSFSSPPAAPAPAAPRPTGMSGTPSTAAVSLGSTSTLHREQVAQDEGAEGSAPRAGTPPGPAADLHDPRPVP